jgi:hypothetical protein
MKYIFFELGIFLQFPILPAAAIFQLFALMGLPIHFFFMHETKLREGHTPPKGKKSMKYYYSKDGRGAPDVPTQSTNNVSLFYTVPDPDFQIRASD